MSTICIYFYILTKLDDGGVFFISQCFKRQSSLSSSENPVIYREVKKKKRKFPCWSILFLFFTRLNIIERCNFFFTKSKSVFILHFFCRATCIKFKAKSYDLSSTESISLVALQHCIHILTKNIM